MDISNVQDKKKGFAGKDLITIGIYTALYIVALFVACVVNVTPITFMFYPAAGALLGATFYIMLAMKVKKFGAVIIWGVIVGMLFAVLGMPIACPFMILGAVIAQFIVKSTNYESFWADTIGFVIVSVCSVGGYLQLFVTTDTYLAEASNRGLSEEFVNGLADCASIPFLFLIIAVTAVCAVLGCLFAKVILKKHLKKAGVM